MRQKIVIIMLSLALTLSTLIAVQPANSAGTTVLSFSPTQVSVPYPQSFIVNVSIANVTNLNAWQIKVLFNPGVLKYSNMTVPQDNILGNAGGTVGLSVISDNLAGYVRAFDGLWDSSTGMNGSGTVCQIIFNVSQPGISTLTFADLMTFSGTVLYDPKINLIPFSVVNGSVQVTASGFQTFTFPAVKKGVTYNVTLFTNSTVSGFSYSEILDILTFYLSGPDGTKGSCTASIPKALQNGTLALLMNGTSSYFSQSADDPNRYLCFSYNHSAVKIEVLTTISGDLNGDRRIDMKDIAIVAYAFGTSPGMARWNPLADVNLDFRIDMKDVGFVAKGFGRTYRPS